MKPMRIEYVRLWIQSDQHLELTRGWDLPAVADRPGYDVLVVAGDLVTKMERGVAWLLERVTDRPVIYVAGNHEFYGCDIDRTVEKARALAAGTNVHVLQNDSVEINGVVFIGCTFWTDFDLFGDADYAMMSAAEIMNDYRKIRLANYTLRLRPRHTLERHQESRAFIATELRKPKLGSRVVVTHMGPHPDAIRGGYENDIASAAYTSDASDLMAMGVDAWIHGHTHETYDRMVGGCRLVTNQKGYGPWPPGEMTWDNKDFDPNFVIEI
jgi:predicted phosphodiesterase